MNGEAAARKREAVKHVLKEQGRAQALFHYWNIIMNRTIRYGKAVAFIDELALELEKEEQALLIQKVKVQGRGA